MPRGKPSIPRKCRQQLLDAIKRLLILESQYPQARPLVAENWHLIDGETQALLDSLVEGLPTARVLLLLVLLPLGTTAAAMAHN